MKLVFLLSPSSTFLQKDVEMLPLSKQNSRLSDEYVKENPQVNQAWIQVRVSPQLLVMVHLPYDFWRRQCSKQKAGLSPTTMYSNFLTQETGLFIFKLFFFAGSNWRRRGGNPPRRRSVLHLLTIYNNQPKFLISLQI